MNRLFIAALALALTAAVLSGQQAAPPAATRPSASGASQQAAEAQTPPLTFRSEVSFIEVDAVVRDARGNFVRDLKPEEFRVLEDGVPQDVTAFGLIDIPVVQPDRALFLPAEIDPDVRSNTQGAPGRIYVLLLDDMHTGFERSIRVKEVAKEFIRRNVGANDLVAILHTSGRSDGAQDFTNSRRLLTQAVDKFVGRKLRSAYLNRMDVYTRNRNNGDMNVIRDADDAERLYRARNLLETVENLSGWLAGIHGRRKALVLIGEGVDYSLYGASTPTGPTSSTGSGSSDSGSSDSSSSSQLPVAENRGDGLALLVDSQEAIAAALRANVNIYAIDPRGLAVGTEDLITMSGSPANDPSLGLSPTDMADELRRAQDSLRVLAESTGGFASVSSNDFGPALQRIMQENSSYYMLGYNPTNTKRDGRFRRIEVRVTRPGPFEVRARRGYEAPSGKAPRDKAAGTGTKEKVEASAGTSKELREALDNPVQVSDLRFAVFAAPMKGPNKKAVVAIVSQFNGRDIAFMTAGGKHTNALEMSYVAVNREGKVTGGNRERVDLSLKPDTFQRVLQAGFRVQSRLELPPGSYQLRVAAREAGGRVGSVHYDLLVPDFEERSLGMSGLVLTSKAAGVVPTAGSIPEIGEGLPTPPTTARAFRTSDELTVLAEVYDNHPERRHSVDITTQLKAEGGLPVFSSTETRSSEELGNRKGGFGHAVKIPLAGAAPGLYVLRVEARSTLRGALGIAREVQIQVVQ